MKKDNVKVALFFIYVSFVLTMSVIMGIFFAMNSYIQQKKSQIPLYVFLKPSASASQVNSILNNIKQINGVLKVRLIDKNQALQMMVKKFQIDSKLFVSNPFPYSIEVFFEPSYTNETQFEHFRDIVMSPIVDKVAYPKGVLKEIESIHSKMIYFSEVVLAVLYGVEFVVFLSIMTIFYSHRKFDYDTLKFFGIKRFAIFRLFLKETIKPVFYGFLFSVVLIILLYVFYDKYGQLPFINKEILKNAQENTFLLNILVGFVFTLFSSAIVFVVNDEKV